MDHIIPTPIRETPAVVNNGELIRPEIPPYIDSSMLSTFRACPRKFFWAYAQQLQPQGKSVHLIAGGAFAAGIDAVRRFQFSKENRAVPCSPDQLAAAALPAFCKAWGDFEAPEDSPKNFYNVFGALEEYLAQHHPFYDPVQPVFSANGEPASEFSFAIPLKLNHPSGDPFIFVGRFDLLGTFHDRPVICDEKTTSALGTFWQKQWALRGQFIGYCWACRKLGINVDTAIIRGIGLLKTETKFLTAIETYGDHLLERWEQELYHTLELILHYDDKGHYPYTFGDACGSYGGCAYQALCGAANVEPWFSHYDRRLWSPIELD